MADFDVLNEFKSITNVVGNPIQGLGALKPERDAKASILRTLCSSLLGTVVTTMFWKDKSHYVAIDDAGACLVTFSGEDHDSNTKYDWAGMESITTSSDEQFVNIGFTHGGEAISWQILRHQIVEPDGSCLTDVDACRRHRGGAGAHARRLAL